MKNEVVTPKRRFQIRTQAIEKTRRIGGNKTSQNERIYHKKHHFYSLAGQIRRQRELCDRSKKVRGWK